MSLTLSSSEIDEEFMNKENDINEACLKDLIHTFRQLDEARRVEWGNLFDKYTKITDTKESLEISNLSLYAARKSNMPTLRTSRKHSKSLTQKASSRKSKSDAYTITVANYDTFLCSYITSAELQHILLDYKQNKISLLRLIDVVENTFKSNLRQLLILREEARYLGHKNFKKYQQSAESEAARLQQFLGKNCVVLYISIHNCSKSIDEIIYLIEEEYRSNISNYCLRTLKNINVKPEEKVRLHKKFVSEWHRLRQFLSAEYLIQYCDELES